MSLASQITPHLGFLRRYARALTGSQESGDVLVASTLESIIAERSVFPADVNPRLGLYKVFHATWAASNLAKVVVADVARPEAGQQPSSFADIAGARLAAITPLSRQALLLGAMEGFTTEDVGYLLDQSPSKVLELVGDAAHVGL